MKICNIVIKRSRMANFHINLLDHMSARRGYTQNFVLPPLFFRLSFCAHFPPCSTPLADGWDGTALTWVITMMNFVVFKNRVFEKPHNTNSPRKFLQDQHLHPDEPIHVDAVHRLEHKTKHLVIYPNKFQTAQSSSHSV